MCEAVRKLLTIKILLALLLVSVSGNTFLAYKLNQISGQIDILTGDQAADRLKHERALKSLSQTGFIKSTPVTFK